MDNAVTIVMPVRKQTAYFREALESALRQTVPVQILVHDSSPQDAGFREIIGKDLDRVKYYHFMDEAGIAGDWNRAMSLAETTWISFFHQDDILMPNCIELLLEAMLRMPGRPLYFGLDDGIDAEGIVRFPKAHLADHEVVEIPPEVYAIMNQFGAPGALLNRDVAFSLGGFTPGLKMTLDWDMWVRLNLHGGTVRINEVTAQFRDHFDPERGTTVQELTGEKLGKIHIQLKRNLARLKAKFPDYVPPPNPGLYLAEMARADLCVKGSHLTKRGRRICFLHIWRQEKMKLSGHSRLAGLKAYFLCGFWLAYSYVRPYRITCERFLGLRAK